jgi:hypothetical protein
MGIALLGRIVTLVIDGPHDGFILPMIVEGVTVVIALFCSRVLTHHAFESEE